MNYGYIGTIKVYGKPKKAWVFIMVLSYSRYMYACSEIDEACRRALYYNSINYGTVKKIRKAKGELCSSWKR